MKLFGRTNTTTFFSFVMSDDSRPLQVYRIPVYSKRPRKYGSRITMPEVRSPSPDPKVIVARRRASTPPTSSVRIVEVQSPESTTYVKRIYPQKRRTRIIRERSPSSSSSESASTIASPPPPALAVVPRREQVVRIATTSTSASGYSDRVAPVARRTRRAMVETPVAIVSETPLVNRGTSPRKQWKKREKPVPLDLDRDVYVSDEDYYEEAFADGVRSQFSLGSRTYTRCYLIFRPTNRNLTNSANGAMANAHVDVPSVISVNGITVVRAVVGSSVYYRP